MMIKYTAFTILALIASLTWELDSLDSRGERLAKEYCGSCHLYPEPALLDRATWESSVLPDMGRRLGIEAVVVDSIEELIPEELEIIESLKIYPEKPLLKEKEWKAIQKFYLKYAPDSLESAEMSIEIDTLVPFEPRFIDLGAKPVPQVSLLEFDQGSSSLYIGNHSSLYTLSTLGQITGSWEMHSPTVDIVKEGEEVYVLNIGSIAPSNLKQGALFPLEQREDENPKVVAPLRRPVHAEVADLNNDGRDDIVISSFGNHVGKLAWYDDFEEEHVLSALPGTRKTEIVDMDGDGDLDIVALQAQAWEGISIFYNDGNGVFSEDKVLAFSPLHGVSYFELSDFNKDGHPDILMTNGDNWDLSPIRKPYHGVRIYMNDGKNQFSEEFFFSQPGSNKAVSADFDGDGDVDIVACAFYDELPSATASVVYLENKGNLNFVGNYIEESIVGNWLTMDTGDYNKDGKLDVFLGSYYHSFEEYRKALMAGNQDFPQVLMLVNRSK